MMTIQAATNAPAMAQPMPIPAAAPLEMLLAAAFLAGLDFAAVVEPMVLLLRAIVVCAPPSQLSVVKKRALRFAL